MTTSFLIKFIIYYLTKIYFDQLNDHYLKILPILGDQLIQVFYKHFKIGYLNPTIAKMVKRIMVKYGGITAELKHKSSNSLPFEYVDIILKIG